MAEIKSTSSEQTIVQAATVIVFRQQDQGVAEILMVQRAKDLSFAGAASVFPGGKVHESDILLAKEVPALPSNEAAARIAGIREVLEEAGLVIGVKERVTADDAGAARAMLAAREDMRPVLDRFGWTLDLDTIVPFAHWLPSFKPGRIFDTRFYLTDLGSGRVDLSPDLGESTRLFWASARDALAMVEAGQIKAIYPTRRNLERLAQFGSFAEAQAHARDTGIETVSPWIEQVDGIDMLRIPDGLGYPVTIAPLAQINID